MWDRPDCDGIHSADNPLKPGTHDSNWEAGPPPDLPVEDGGSGGGGDRDGSGDVGP